MPRSLPVVLVSSVSLFSGMPSPLATVFCHISLTGPEHSRVLLHGGASQALLHYRYSIVIIILGAQALGATFWPQVRAIAQFSLRRAEGMWSVLSIACT